MKEFDELLGRLGEVADIGDANSVLYWDQATYMPPGGAKARARQLATLGRLRHQRATDPELGRLLDALASYEESQPYESFEASLIRLARRNFERASRIPDDFVATLRAHASQSYQTWTKARPASDWAAVRDNLARTLELSRQLSEYLAPFDHPIDPLIDRSDFGMTAATVRSVFGELRDRLVPIVERVVARGPADDGCLRGHFDIASQRRLGEEVIRAFGYDFERGRQDETHHPFCTKFGADDVRITTRFCDDFLSPGLFATMHEAGHAMYEQGIDPRFDRTPLSRGTSAGVHESQSRLWENVVGRSRDFWESWYPRAQQTFESLADVSLETFVAAINRVEPGLIRVEADELTYNLHVILRFELECQLLEGSLEIDDLPEAWDARYRSDLGLSAPEIRNGVLQDVHWFSGPIGGAFQGYTLGNLLNAQFYETALAAGPSIPDEIRAGRFEALHDWLRDNIYRYGSVYTAPELIEKVTGGGIEVDPFIRYVERKFDVA